MNSPKFVLVIRGRAIGDKLHEALQALPEGVGYSAQVMGPTSGSRDFEISFNALTGAEVQDIAVQFSGDGFLNVH